MEESKATSSIENWPNKKPIVDGVTPTEKVPQISNLFENDSDDDLDREMEE